MKGRKGHLTAREREFAKRYAATGDRGYSAANYPQASSAATRLLQNADVQDEIRRIARKKLLIEGAQVGVDVLVEIAKDKGQAGGTRVKAAAELVKHSGIAIGDGLDEASLADMKPGELDALLDRARRELALRQAGAKTIEHEPAAPDPVGVFD